MTERPKVAITMGDGAGVGPEIIVKALNCEEVFQFCRPVVIGDIDRLRDAAKICGIEGRLNPVDHPDEGLYQAGTIDVIDLDLLPDALEYGKVQVSAGEAAYQYVVAGARLATDHAVGAICTAPLNKEALQAAGHVFPGHTELLAHLTGAREVSMMLSTGQVKVIHVTTHIGLIDAIESINPDLVLRTIRRGHEALVASGVQNPVIAVCGINPHAGENGLFGRGEEDEKVAPAIERARGEGIDASGPLAADTVFYRAGRGDFDLVVAMYHDQGHGPVKILGLEAGVNITVGLDVIRTSVDHGTAFDIAGTGRADERSMIEAIRQAADLAPRAVREGASGEVTANGGRYAR